MLYAATSQAATRGGPHVPTSTGLQRILQPSCRRNSAFRSTALLAHPCAPSAPALRSSRATIHQAGGPYLEDPPGVLPAGRCAFPWPSIGPDPPGPGASAERQYHKNENVFITRDGATPGAAETPRAPKPSFREIPAGLPAAGAPRQASSAHRKPAAPPSAERPDPRPERDAVAR